MAAFDQAGLMLLREIRDLQRESRDLLYSLRIDLGPLADYYKIALAELELAQGVSVALPEGFPGREKLAAVGITAVDQIPNTVRRIEAIVGDGETAMQVVQEKIRYLEEQNG